MSRAKIASLLMESWNKMKRIFKNCLKKYLLNRLVQKYSLLLTSIILLTVAALCVYVTYTINLSIDSQKITPFPKLTAM